MPERVIRQGPAPGKEWEPDSYRQERASFRPANVQITRTCSHCNHQEIAVAPCCVVCGKPVRVGNYKRKYCSDECRNSARRKKK